MVRGVLLKGAIVAMVLLGLPVGCNRAPDDTPTLNIKLYQSWELQPGDTLGDRRILGGLGDISISLEGNNVYAPFDGRTQIDQHRCLIFSSPDVPAYLFRLCGLQDMHPGTVNQGDAIGRGNLLQFATLRKQPNGTWAIVEPAKAILERTLKKT
ncbi:MAG: hypothetical protein ACAF41_14080 [Leptolyngbya sp. BL-A-14]